MSSKPKTPDERLAILNRLRSSQGHLRAVIRMVEEDRPCEQILHQLDAIQAALSATRRVLCACELQHSADIILHSPDEAARAAEMQRFASLFDLQARHLVSEESNG
jgi:DNA-binding FrmR family transcriptional regulator